MSPPSSTNLEHITHVKWENASTANSGSSTREDMVDWIDNNNGVAVVGSGVNQSRVGTVDPKNGRPKYLRTYADGEWNNNLLSLPTF
jgi:hypothetical protein